MNYGAQVVQTTTSQPTVFTVKCFPSSVETTGVAHKQHAHIQSTHRPVKCHIDVSFQTDDVPTLLLML